MKVGAYEFADGARFQAGAKVDNPNVVGRHIDFLRRDRKGELTPEDVVSDAKNPNSPLHSFFEWDDGLAAEQHRLHQARGLIRAVVAVYVQPDKPAHRTRAFVHIPEPTAPHYRSADCAMKVQKTRDMVLRRAWEELMAWRKRYQDLKEFSDLFETIEAAAKLLSVKR